MFSLYPFYLVSKKPNQVHTPQLSVSFFAHVQSTLLHFAEGPCAFSHDSSGLTQAVLVNAVVLLNSGSDDGFDRTSSPNLSLSGSTRGVVHVTQELNISRLQVCADDVESW